MDDLINFAAAYLAERNDTTTDDAVEYFATAPDFYDHVDVMFKLITLITNSGLDYEQLVMWYDETPPRARCVEFLPQLIADEHLERLRAGEILTVRVAWDGDGWAVGVG